MFRRTLLFRKRIWPVDLVCLEVDGDPSALRHRDAPVLLATDPLQVANDQRVHSEPEQHRLEHRGLAALDSGHGGVAMRRQKPLTTCARSIRASTSRSPSPPSVELVRLAPVAL